MATRYRWKGLARSSLEVLLFEPARVRAEVIVGDRVWAYELELDDWRVTRARIGPMTLEHDGRGWRVDGVPRPDLADAIDLDIVITPFTNTLPIRRLALDVGAGVDIVTAWVDTDALEVHPDPQRYTRVAADVYRFDSLDSDFTADIEVDADGFVVFYPGLFERI
jgi:hypothetical protein